MKIINEKNTPYLVLLLLVVGCNSTSNDSMPPAMTGGTADPNQEIEREILEYPLPNDEVGALFSSSYTYPARACVPVPEGSDLDEQWITQGEEGDELCYWNNAQGCIPPGEIFTEWASCEVPMTTSARFFKYPGPKTDTDQSVLNDPEWQKESEWVLEEIRSCGCVCCHDSAYQDIQSGFATAFDISAPGVWTDTFTDFGLLTASGTIDTELLGGTFDPASNFGFDRSHTIFPTTDVERMQRFFNNEIQRRGLTEAEIQEQIDAVPLRFAGLFTNVYGETTPCEPGVGIDANGVLSWEGADLRYIYVLEENASNVGDPPGLDKPEGMIWRLDWGGELFKSGEITYGEVPQGAGQFYPAEGSPASLEAGQTYKLFLLRDFGPTRVANCKFVYPIMP